MLARLHIGKCVLTLQNLLICALALLSFLLWHGDLVDVLLLRSSAVLVCPLKDKVVLVELVNELALFDLHVYELFLQC